LRPEVAERFQLFERHMDEARFDAPVHRLNDFILQNHIADARSTSRLESCTLLAAAHGVEYRWPLWDTRLVQQYLSTPTIEKVGPGGNGRYLHRRAVTGVVPDGIIWRTNQGINGKASMEAARPARLAAAAAQARRHEAHLHPALEELLDRRKLRELVAQAQRGEIKLPQTNFFIASVRAIRWLNHWLQGGPVD